MLLKERVARAKQTLPNGYCGLPLQLEYPHPNACLSCDAFLSDARFQPVLEQQLARTRELIGRARTFVEPTDAPPRQSAVAPTRATP